MSIVAIFSASHCHGDEVAAAVAARLELQALGQEPHQAEFSVDPGVFKEISEPQIVAAGGGGGFPWPIALLGAAGAAVVGVLVLGGSGGGGGGEELPTGPGTITVVLP